jgi:hypothetical protein
VPATMQKQPTMPTADMQWRARRIALRAAKLADQAAPLSRRAARTAKSGAGSAAIWAKPRVGRVRAWMAVRAARSSVSVQENIGPKISSVLAATARRLDPPRPQSRRWPKVLAGTALLAAGAAAAAAMAMRKRSQATPRPVPPRKPASSNGGQRTTVLNPNVQTQRPKSESEVNGLSRTR